MLNALLRHARKSNHKHHHAVMVESGGSVKAIGYNHNGLHAEVVALQKLWPSERVGTRILSVRFSKSGKLAMAKPCQNCQKYLKKHGIKKVTYSDSNGNMQILTLK